MSAEVEKQ